MDSRCAFLYFFATFLSQEQDTGNSMASAIYERR